MKCEKNKPGHEGQSPKQDPTSAKDITIELKIRTTELLQ